MRRLREGDVIHPGGVIGGGCGGYGGTLGVVFHDGSSAAGAGAGAAVEGRGRRRLAGSGDTMLSLLVGRR